MDSPREYDIVVIGLGPAGLRALSYGGFLGASILGIDELDYAGGKITMLYGWKPVPDVGMYPFPVGSDFVAMLVDDARQYGVTLKTREKVLAMPERPQEPGGTFLLQTEHEQYRARAIIIAGGTGSIRLNYFPQESFLFYLGNGLSYYQVRPQECAGKEVLIVGGGASATEMAPYIAEYADHVTLIHRRREFRRDAEPFVAKLQHPKITVLLPYELQEIHGKYRVNAVTVRNRDTGETKHLRMDAIIACLGYGEDLGQIANWGFREEGMRGKLLRVNERFETTIPGIFAIGECIAPPWQKTRIPLIQTWLSEAVHAVSHAYAHVTGRKPFRGYGTVITERRNTGKTTQ